MSGYEIKSQSDYTEVKFETAVTEMSWTDLEAAGKSVSETLTAAAPAVVIVNLSALNALPEGFVAVLLRVWRSMDQSEQKLAVVATSENVHGDLKSAGLESMWPVADSLESAAGAVGVAAVPSAAADSDTAAADSKAAVEQPAGTAPFLFEQNRGYCSVQFSPVLMTLAWAEVESATTEVIEKLKASKSNSVMVDLGPMEIINSGLVASLVRIWKTMQEEKGQFSLASPNEMVTDVLKSAGLWKLWTVVDDREEAIYELGAGEVAEVENRERRILAYVAVPFSVMSAIALGVKYTGSTPLWNANTHILALLLAAAGAVTGIISLVKDKGGRRLLSLIAVLISGGILSSIWFNENPLAILGVQTPAVDGTSEGGGDAGTADDADENGEDTEPDAEEMGRQTTGDPTQGNVGGDSDDPTKSGGLQSSPGDPTKGGPSGQPDDPTSDGPGGTSGTPIPSGDTSSSPTQGAPTGTPGDPTQTSGEPTPTQDAPTGTPDDPTQTPGAPSGTPGEPTPTPETLPGTPADPTQTPDAPSETSGEPAPTQGAPSGTPSDPT